MPSPGAPGALSRLRGLLEAARAVRAGGDLQPLLEAIARVISVSLGFGTVVINLHRPAWDDFEVVTVHGSDDARNVLLGTSRAWEGWRDLLDPRFERAGTYLVPHGEFEWSEDIVSYVPPSDVPLTPGEWHPEDALFVPLRASNGRLLGIVSVDEPIDGRRPSDAQLEVLNAVAGHAALAVEHAQEAAEADRQRIAVQHLLRVSARLTSRGSVEDMLLAVCEGVREALGFLRVIVALTEGPDHRLSVRANVGWSAEELAVLPPVPLSAVSRLLRPEHQREGCVVLSSEEGEALMDPGMRGVPRGRHNGRGPLAWRDHWLLVPLHDRDGAFTGILWVDEPEDRLLPSDEGLQALRAFANQASSAVESTRRFERLRRLTEVDPFVAAEPDLAADAHARSRLGAAGDRSSSVLVCDLDGLKRVTATLGGDAREDVLRRFTALLSRCTRGSDLPARVDGEAFAVVLPDTDRLHALVVAERLQRAVGDEFADLPIPVSVSVALAAANTSAGLSSDEQLAAAMLLAESLDVRDVAGTRHAHTVGALAEQTARCLGWSPERVARVRAAGVLHDIGKLGIAGAILSKPAALDPEEWREIRRHPEVGAQILEHANLPDIAAWVRAHHERLDGRGYPSGLRGAAIPEEARVLAVADAYEAMTTDRPYRAGRAPEEAEAELRRAAGTQFDSDVVEALLEALAEQDDGVPSPV